MRKSGKIILVLLGASSLHGCDSSPEQKRNVYASQEECIADYQASDCTAGDWAAGQNTPGGGGYGGGGRVFYGPWYQPYYGAGYSSNSFNPGPGRTGKAASSISRGGFGFSASHFGGNAT